MKGGGDGGDGGDGGGAGRGRRPRRTAWIVVAALSAVLVVAPAARQVWAYASTESGTLSGGSGERPVSAVEIDAGGADVRLTPRSDGRVAYEARVRWSAAAPEIEESWLGDTLRLTPRCPAVADLVASGFGCSVDLGVTVPAGIPVKVTAGSGTVAISGLGGSVDAEVGAGTLLLSALRGPLRASVGSGSLDASGLSSAQAEIRAGAGSAVARFAAPPDRVTARAGTGRVRLTVPAATRFRVTARVGAGRLDIAPGMDDPAAPGRLDISADAGRAEAGY
ncbi:hypothetical protein [Streptomyces vinaceus]|uniref:hypothetical protein n=1 Tax=Streptomyces vinaceus TaxID=1960 RepID=UPI00142EF3FA|nr:hypothetical protein [Streptomyces vinaceus]GHE35371.1 hypothetical protein GCM10017778_17810 [Streptomyces vinaceus]